MGRWGCRWSRTAAHSESRYACSGRRDADQRPFPRTLAPTSLQWDETPATSQGHTLGVQLNLGRLLVRLSRKDWVRRNAGRREPTRNRLGKSTSGVHYEQHVPPNGQARMGARKHQASTLAEL